ncbi:hypothetical protein SESBI_37612 [Sesbania bispinosa]|nr:hypothetical protein SESBI_37612 [Sesbania bispinosa]
MDNEDPLCPIVHVSRKEFQRACKPWKSSVIVKLLGKRVGLRLLQLRLLKIWNHVGDMEIIDLEFDYFLVKFSISCDFDMVFQSGLWMILGHYLVVQKWQPHFIPREDELSRVSVWVHIPGLPMEYYYRDILWRIGNVLGKTMRGGGNVKDDNNEVVHDNDTTKDVREEGCFGP